MKTHKKKKIVRMRGTRYHGWAAKKHKGSGSRGGKGMSGSGKRADQKKTLIINKFGNKYFGKGGETSKVTERNKNKVITLENIEKNIDSLVKKYGEKKGNVYELNLNKYKVLGDYKLNIKLIVKVRDISKKARSIIEKAGGKVEVKKKKKVEEKNGS